MSEDKMTETDAIAAGRQLIDAALHRNPLVAIATAIVVPLLALLRRRHRLSAASIEKVKLESYRYRPVGSSARAATGPKAKQHGSSMAAKGQEKGFPSSESGPQRQLSARSSAQKGGNRHG